MLKTLAVLSAALVLIVAGLLAWRMQFVHAERSHSCAVSQANYEQAANSVRSAAEEKARFDADRFSANKSIRATAQAGYRLAAEMYARDVTFRDDSARELQACH